MTNLKKALLILAFSLLPVLAGAQTVTKTFNNASLSAVLAEIETQSGVSFIYKVSDVSSAKPVTASFKDAPLTAVLDKVLGKEFTYSVKGKMISITKNQNTAVQVQKEVSKKAPAPSKSVPIKGKIVDAEGQPIISAAVFVEGKESGGTLTDLQGNFQITVPEGSELKVSCIGYRTETFVASSSRPMVSLTMEEDSEMLDDVVVVGYGVQKKESVLGAISQVTSEALVNTGNANITQALSGKVSGMYSYQSSGAPGENDAVIQIRGNSSWNEAAPLVMVDGVERSFNDLDPNEVETISVLKDASASAVFGAKGANGVILVTTKRGKIGKAKSHISFNMGLERPTNLPETYDAETILNARNIALKNDNVFSSLHSQELINKYKSGENPLRYPQNNWYEIMLRDFATSYNANYSFSGGTESVKYYVNLGFNNEGSIVKDLPGMTKNYSANRLNYRANLDFNLSKTTVLSARFGGYSKIVNTLGRSPNGIFNDMYRASTIQFPAYYPAEVMEQYPDPDYPGLAEFRRSSSTVFGCTFANPVQQIANGDFSQTSQSSLALDVELDQKLDFITKGLSLNGKVSYTTIFTRTSQSASLGYHSYTLDWDIVDSGEGNPWLVDISSLEVIKPLPYKVTKNTTPSNSSTNFYLEGSVRYDRKFGGHQVNAMALGHIRNYVVLADYPTRSQAYVGRVNYNYKGKYLFEGNVGITGSEQFSPNNRYGVFPSVAVGYFISKEKFWKEAMPWWSTFKIRYSDGLVGSDAARGKWLYFSTYNNYGSYIAQGKVANETARWETAHKRDIGFEMGWLKDNLVLTVDLFDEHRKDILVTPLTTMFVATSYNDINAGAIKKHGVEVELKWRNTTPSGFFYEIGGMVGFNENRITQYPDSPYAPEYQKSVGKQQGGTSLGQSLVDDRIFGTIDEKHGYVGADSAESQGREYKFLDYNCDGILDVNDRFPIVGSKLPPVTYSGSLALAYKGFSMNATFVGTMGKYTSIENSLFCEFYKDDYILHSNSMNYWTPTNPNATHASLSRLKAAIQWFGRSDSTGTGCDVKDVVWLPSDYFALRDLRLAYKMKSSPFLDKVGLNGLTFTMTGSNLFCISSILDSDPQREKTVDGYYPIMMSIRLGLNVDF